MVNTTTVMTKLKTEDEYTNNKVKVNTKSQKMSTINCVYSIPYVGKIWRGKILANLANGVQIAKFFHANSYKYSEITEDLPADSPKFSSPFDSSVMIRQNFPPPKFSHVR